MRKWHPIRGNFASAVTGVVVGGLIALAGDSLTGTHSPKPRPPLQFSKIHLLDESGSRMHFPSRILLAWSPREGLPLGTARALEQLRVVRRVTTVLAGVDWLYASRTSSGVEIDAPRAGFAIPIESALVRPKEYAAFVPPGDREAILALKRGGALLSQTAAKLRGAAEGLRVRLSDREVEVTGIVSDTASAGYEMLLGGKVPAAWERVDRFFLIELKRADGRKIVERRINSLLQPGALVRLRAQGETPFLRYGDAVLPHMLIKDAFGEFAARPLPDGRLIVDPRWRRQNIVTRRVPLLGTVTCHRVLFPQLRAALRDINSAALGWAIDPDQYAGCYKTRFIDADPGGRLSHHSWGIAFDVNALENAYGTKANIDGRLVEIIESHGFTWGGRWLIPDGMHFEWVRFP
jgi:hypothetical protein